MKMCVLFRVNDIGFYIKMKLKYWKGLFWSLEKYYYGFYNNVYIYLVWEWFYYIIVIENYGKWDILDCWVFFWLMLNKKVIFLKKIKNLFFIMLFNKFFLNKIFYIIFKYCNMWKILIKILLVYSMFCVRVGIFLFN